MAPKKKGANKKGGDDWEAELGESIAPANAAADPTGDAPAAADDEPSAGGGGLMNLMRKNKEKRKKKGFVEDDVDGENAGEGDAPPETLTLPDLSAKQAEEANAEDEFALPDKKGKGGKGKQQHQKAAATANDEETDASGRVLTKAEKEKLKKEREKQRKKEQVRISSRLSHLVILFTKANTPV
jgi:translation initiation factor 5B